MLVKALDAALSMHVGSRAYLRCALTSSKQVNEETHWSPLTLYARLGRRDQLSFSRLKREAFEPFVGVP